MLTPKEIDDCRHRRAAASAGIRYTPSCPSPGRLGLRHRTNRLNPNDSNTGAWSNCAGWVMADDPVSDRGVARARTSGTLQGCVS
ncbi:hypothetical protein [Phyllobacterium sophorae]|uniref:Uncharacterized protein n=1 Tax=Phyllobacterium sophorae TaxID=1520277 RepID=A0A2P7B597_9HYPH|nr:hypothetical protein [Phyllobacterium sophorae]PSH61647.1 hypothetical protein CU103_22855 [Phyllobacterium sophorae]